MTSNRVDVVPYDPAWPQRFQEESNRIREAIGQDGIRRAFDMEHIGSTSVPELAAKPVLDILAVGPRLEDLERATPALQRLGYEARGEYGIAGRRYFVDREPRGLLVHLHGFASGHAHAGRHIRFRDYLRAHPKDAQAYGSLKLKLAEVHGQNRKAYQSAKEAFIEELHQRAERYDYDRT